MYISQPASKWSVQKVWQQIKRDEYPEQKLQQEIDGSGERLRHLNPSPLTSDKRTISIGEGCFSFRLEWPRTGFFCTMRGHRWNHSTQKELYASSSFDFAKQKVFKFREARKFVNQIGELAEEQPKTFLELPRKTEERYKLRQGGTDSGG